MKPYRPTRPHEKTPTFDDRLTELRATRSQRDLAKALQVSQAQISLIENGKVLLRTEEDVRTYAEALGTDPDELVSEWYSSGYVDQEQDFFLNAKSLFPASLAIEAKRARQWKADKGTFIAPGISLATLKDLLKEDHTALEAVQAWCKSYEERHQANAASRPRSTRKQSKKART